MLKGEKVVLVPATLADREQVYQWCFQSETTKAHSGPPHYPEKVIATFAEFCRDYYEEYYFTGTRPAEGRGYLIISCGEAIGFISYSSFHLQGRRAELDIWLGSEANCGKGLGTQALQLLGDHLKASLGICELIIAPANKNVRAIRSYEKAGFKKSEEEMASFLREEYIEAYGNGDYGAAETALLTKEFTDK